jgi:hypothetical protein
VIHLIHGIHTEPTSQVKGLIGYLLEAGFEVAYPEYGYELALETRVVNSMLVGTLLPYIKPGDILIGHSNGCAIAYHLMLLGAPAEGAIFINGALETNIIRPGTCKWIDVYSNQGDTLTEAAMLGARLGLVDSVWGELGHLGYTGKDPLIPNYFCDKTPGMPVVLGHSDFFTPAKLKAWAGWMVDHRLKVKPK